MPSLACMKGTLLQLCNVSIPIHRSPDAILARNAPALHLQADNAFRRNDHDEIDFSIWSMHPTGQPQGVEDNPILSCRVIPEQSEDPAFSCADTFALYLSRNHLCHDLTKSQNNVSSAHRS